METQNKIYMEHKMIDDDRLPVYDAEIIHEGEEKAKVVSAKAKLPEKKLAYRLGKTAGALFTALGFLNEFRRIFRTGYTGGSGSGSGRGRGMGKGKRKRKGKMRRFI